ncbi:hypothetical protein ScPMuIL_009982 [Solemya velum]
MDNIFVLTLFFLSLSLRQISAQGNVVALTLRLAGPGSTQSQGRVEVFYQNEWGTICNDQFGDDDASVACRMLGFNEGGEVARTISFGPGDLSAPIWLDDLDCRGSELSLSECMSAGWGKGDCGHQEDVGVICKLGSGQTDGRLSSTAAPVEIHPSICTVPDPNIRLIGPSNMRGRGIVEVLLNGKWGAVCDDFWGLSNAQVVCRSLCYNPVNARAGVQMGIIDYDAAQPIIMDDVRCSGNENSIHDCDRSSEAISDCKKTELASVTCIPLNNSAAEAPVPLLTCENQRLSASFSRRRDPFLEEKHLTIGKTYNGSCGVKTSNTSRYITIHIPFQECGTVISQNATHIIYSNVVKYPYTSVEQDIVRINSYWVHISCEFDRNAIVDRDMLPLTETVTQRAPGQFRIQMMFYQNNSFSNPITDYPLKLTLGEWINVGIYLDSPDSRLKIVVPNCRATPSTNPAETVNYPLFQDKCPNDPSLAFFPLNETAFGYRYQTFKFVDYPIVIIQCDAFICQINEKDASCDRSCDSSNRKKRSAMQNHVIYHVTSVPIFFDSPADETLTVDGEITTKTVRVAQTTTETPTKSVSVAQTTTETPLKTVTVEQMNNNSTILDTLLKIKSDEKPTPAPFEAIVGDETCGPTTTKTKFDFPWGGASSTLVSSVILYSHYALCLVILVNLL